MNAPPAKAGGFGLPLETGSISHTTDYRPLPEEGVVKAFSFSLREKARMRGSNNINRSIAIDHLTLTLLCPLGVYALWVLLQGEGTFATPS